MAANDARRFDRRGTDINVEALALRVTGLESRVEVVERDLKANTLELSANTALTKQVHSMGESIKTDTAELIEFAKDAAVFTKWGKRLAGALVVLIPIVSGGYGLGHFMGIW